MTKQKKRRTGFDTCCFNCVFRLNFLCAKNVSSYRTYSCWRRQPCRTRADSDCVVCTGFRPKKDELKVTHDDIEVCCPSCQSRMSLDECDCIGAEPDCVFCPQCGKEFCPGREDVPVGDDMPLFGKEGGA